MEDIPPNMPTSAYGAFEPDGMCIWVNLDNQATVPFANVGVVSHEYAHYVQAISSYDGVDDLLSLLLFVHSGIQHLEDLEMDVEVPLSEWCLKKNCPNQVEDYVRLVKARENAIRASYRADLDVSPPDPEDGDNCYQKNGSYFIRVNSSPAVGVPIGRLTLMEGMAVAKKSEAMENTGLHRISTLKPQRDQPQDLQ